MMMKLVLVLFSGIIRNYDVAALVLMVLSRCERLWRVGRLLGMAENGFHGLDSVRDSTGGVVALNVRSVLSSGFIGFDDMSMCILGRFSVIDGLSDTAVGTILVVSGLNDVAAMVRGCCRGKGLDWVAALAVVGRDSFLGSRDAPSDHLSSLQCF
jgi:hypothetical protein